MDKQPQLDTNGSIDHQLCYLKIHKYLHQPMALQTYWNWILMELIALRITRYCRCLLSSVQRIVQYQGKLISREWMVGCCFNKSLLKCQLNISMWLVLILFPTYYEDRSCIEWCFFCQHQCALHLMILFVDSRFYFQVKMGYVCKHYRVLSSQGLDTHHHTDSLLNWGQATSQQIKPRCRNHLIRYSTLFFRQHSKSQQKCISDPNFFQSNGLG